MLFEQNQVNQKVKQRHQKPVKVNHDIMPTERNIHHCT